MIRKILRRLRERSGSEQPAGEHRLFDPLARKGLFATDWYLRRYPDVAAAGLDPLAHFLSSGLAQGRDPHPLFDTTFYATAYADVRAAGTSPLQHFLTSGGGENRQPHPLVSPRWLRRRLGNDLPLDNPLLGLLSRHAEFGPRPLFDIPLLRQRLGLADTAPAAAVLLAWFARPAAQRPDPHRLFDAAWVRGRYGLADDQCAVTFYCRDKGLTVAPHPLVETALLLQRNPELKGLPDDLTLLDHLLVHRHDLSPTPLFDSEHYARQAGPGVERGAPGLLHYLSLGTGRGLDPGPWFDDALYRQRFGHLLQGMAPLDHYVRHGHETWMTLAPRFSDRFYAMRHAGVLEGAAQPPLLHFLCNLRQDTRAHPDPAWRDDFTDWDAVRDDVAAGAARLGDAAPEVSVPEVSVIVPVFNQFHHTLRCLWSILRAGDAARLQVIVADDGSTDETAAFFGALPGVTYVRNPRNLGFLRSCNAAATHARAPFLFLLNNDTAVLPGWIDSLLATARACPEAGIVGSKLVYPDGTLQEAGGYVWSDGGGANLGRQSDPQEPGFCLRRDADYVSGAAILVPRAAWDMAGGFDDRYAPAYCEDTDLAMRLRQLGWRVVYEPASVVAHFEGVSSGTSTEGGVKAHQVQNFATLRDRWAFALERHLPAQHITPRAIPRPPRPRILMIDHRVPEPDKDAGSVVAWWHVRLLLKMGYEISFLPCDLLPMGRYGRALQALGVELLHAPYVADIHGYLARHAQDFDAFWLVRFGDGGAFVDDLRRLCPRTPIILNTADLHFLRAERAARLAGNPPDLVEHAAKVRAREAHVIGQATETIVVSTHERALLDDLGIGGSFSVVPLVMDVAGNVPPRAERSGIAFVGGYQHPPNVDAVTWFLAEVWPLIVARDPGLEFHIVGSNPPPAFADIRQPGVVVQGHVPDLDGFLAQRIATVVPLTWGAGIKGKIASSMAQGVPVVSTPVGAEGMGLEHGRDILVAETPAALAEAVLRVAGDAALWERLSVAGRAFVAAEYAPGVTHARLLRLLAKAGVAPFAGTCPISGVWEDRRFLHGSDADSLARGPDAPRSAERVAAAALARLAGRPGVALDRLADDALPWGLGVEGDLPVLRAAIARRGWLSDAPRVVVARVPLDDAAAGLVEGLLAQPSVDRMVLACPPVGQRGGEARAPVTPIAAVVRLLEAGGWQVRTDRVPLPEAALTGCVLIEARRG